MKKLLIILLFIPVGLKSQISDCVVIGSGVVWNKIDNTQNDKILHYFVGYFATKAIDKLLEKHTKKHLLLSVSVVSVAAIGKELIDKKFEVKDLYPAGIGIGLATISIKIKF